MKNLKLLLFVWVFSVFNFKANEEDELSYQKITFFNNLINEAKKDDVKIIFKDVSLNSFGDWNKIYKEENFLQIENCEFEIDNNKRIESWRLFINPIIKNIKLGKINYEVNSKDDLNNLFNNIKLKDFNLLKFEKKDKTEDVFHGKIKVNFFLKTDYKYIIVPSVFNFGKENNFKLELLFIFNKNEKLKLITSLSDNSAFYSLVEKDEKGFKFEITDKLNNEKLFEKEEKDGKIFFKNIIKQNKNGKKEKIEFIDLKNIKIK